MELIPIYPIKFIEKYIKLLFLKYYEKDLPELLRILLTFKQTSEVIC